MFNRQFSRFTILVLFFCCSLLADAEKAGNHNIGIGAGFITGYGLSYRQWIGRFGFQCTGAPFLFFDENSSSTIASMGITALAKIKETRYVNLIAYIGPHYHVNRNSYSSDLNAGTTRYDTFFFGGGPGLDFHFLNLSVSLMFGYCFRYELDQKDYGTSFSGEFGFHYSY